MSHSRFTKSLYNFPISNPSSNESYKLMNHINTTSIQLINNIDLDLSVYENLFYNNTLPIVEKCINNYLLNLIEPDIDETKYSKLPNNKVLGNPNHLKTDIIEEVDPLTGKTRIYQSFIVENDILVGLSNPSPNYRLPAVSFYNFIKHSGSTRLPVDLSFNLTADEKATLSVYVYAYMRRFNIKYDNPKFKRKKISHHPRVNMFTQLNAKKNKTITYEKDVKTQLDSNDLSILENEFKCPGNSIDFNEVPLYPNGYKKDENYKYDPKLDPFLEHCCIFTTENDEFRTWEDRYLFYESYFIWMRLHSHSNIYKRVQLSQALESRGIFSMQGKIEGVRLYNLDDIKERYGSNKLRQLAWLYRAIVERFPPTYDNSPEFDYNDLNRAYTEDYVENVPDLRSDLI